MPPEIQPCNVPAESKLYSASSIANFHDAYKFQTRYSNSTALTVWFAHVKATPVWVKGLMALRNKLALLVGLKDLGNFSTDLERKPIEHYCVGDRVGLFTLLFVNDNEVILGDSDKHLDVSVSIFKESVNSNKVTISTVVNIHNRLGRLYMLVVKPMHKLIVPASIKRAEH